MLEAIESISTHPLVVYGSIILFLYKATVKIINYYFQKKVYFVRLTNVMGKLSQGLVERKIGIIADPKNIDLYNLISDSDIFQKENIIQITISELQRIERVEIIVMHWEYGKDYIDKILTAKTDSKALIVYSPSSDENMGIIDSENKKRINETRFSTIVNFKGRLLSDIFLSMLTTGFFKK